MKKTLAIVCLAATVALTAGAARAESIRGKVGVTGELGFMVPADNDSDFLPNRTDAGFIGGGGLIYGIDDHFAADLSITRDSFGSETGDFGVTDIALGAQYRFRTSQRQVVPYLGAGLDILLGDYHPNDGTFRQVDTAVGVHVAGGVDYFLQRQLALTAELRGVLAPNTDITDRLGDHVGNFDPSGFAGLVGIRYFFN